VAALAGFALRALDVRAGVGGRHAARTALRAAGATAVVDGARIGCAPACKAHLSAVALHVALTRGNTGVRLVRLLDDASVGTGTGPCARARTCGHTADGECKRCATSRGESSKVGKGHGRQVSKRRTKPLRAAIARAQGAPWNRFSRATAARGILRGMPAPLSIHGLGQTEITVTWEDEHVSVYPGVYLRARCRCAGCIEEMTGRKLLDEATIAKDIRYERIGLVGGYAVSIVWSDGHTTGIYTFKNLRQWCPCKSCTSATSASP
jgi:DUF971 family protein